MMLAMPEKKAAARIKELLALEPHPVEGGWFRRTYCAGQRVITPYGARHESTAIYYMLETGAFSELHQLKHDEVFHFYLGDPVEMLQLLPDGSSEVIRIGTNLEAGERPQVVVPACVWQGTRLLPGGQVALLGCTVAPGFDYADYTRASAEQLSAQWPAEADRIRALTRF